MSEPSSKRAQTKLQNRQAILDAAREVFAEIGYEAATVRDVIRRTGLAAGTFYNYFRSKDELHDALTADIARRFTPVLATLKARSPDGASFVRAAIGAYFGFLGAETQAWLARRPGGEARPRLAGDSPEVQAVFAIVREVIEAAIASQESPAADSDYMAAACIGVAREVGERMLRRQPIDTEAAADFTVAMILGGLRGLPGSG